MSEVARRYDVNANLVFKWLRDPRFAEEAKAPAFLPVTASAEMGPVPNHLPRTEQVIEPGEDCQACGGTLRPLGEDVT